MWAQVCSKHNWIQNNEKNCAVQQARVQCFQKVVQYVHEHDENHGHFKIEEHL